MYRRRVQGKLAKSIFAIKLLSYEKDKMKEYIVEAI